MLRVTLWGTRGGVPVSGPEHSRYGGATTCLEVECLSPHDECVQRVLIDCGTGLSNLGRSWAPRGTSMLLLQSHFHWDHIQGFPFFAPLYNPHAEIEAWSVPRAGATFEQTLSDQMRAPNFPIGLDALPARLRFRALPSVGSDGDRKLQIAWTEMAHPAGSTAFRISFGGTSIVFTSDVEVGMGCYQRLVDFATGADLLIMDAQYLPEEYTHRRGFGHSTVADAVSVALDAEAAHLVLTHHDAAHSDDRVDAKLELARQLADGRVRVSAAPDGAIFSASAPAVLRAEAVER